MAEFIDINYQEGNQVVNISQGDVIKITKQSIFFENMYGVSFRVIKNQDILVNIETGDRYPVKSYRLW